MKKEYQRPTSTMVGLWGASIICASIDDAQGEGLEIGGGSTSPGRTRKYTEFYYNEWIDSEE